MDRLFRVYQELLTADEARYAEDYQLLYHKLEDSAAYYQGAVIPFLYQPFFFTAKEIKQFKELTAQLTEILVKVVDRYLTDQEFRSYFGFSKELEELNLVDPGYDSYFPMARFDIFYHGPTDFKFCELNADGSSGMVKTNTLEEHFLDTVAVKTLAEDYQIEYCELVESWLDTLLDNYSQFGGQLEQPNIGIMDFEGYGMVSEFEYFQEVLEQKGYSVQIIDPRELSYDGDNLYKDDFRVDLIYRRAVTLDLMEHYQQIEDFLAAYRNQDVCVVGPLRSQIIHNKVIFSILHDEQKVHFLEQTEKEFIKQHIPLTFQYQPTNNKQVNQVKKNQEDFVLKPLDLYGAQGVVIGKDVTEQEWQAKLDKIEPGTYLVQEYCSLPSQELAVFVDGKLKFEPYKYILGLFLYNQEFKGIYTRAAQQDVIASATGCVTLPNFISKADNCNS
ncbi:glutathionylspermidine synthase family protein [Natroniella sulfidigena]|uniref:glutathionylspermidine synthase family protein n=1 Tax=Natroniella sulfidigena TaxID=723921 RepID=UPI002009FF88|nr:glutathionylspermidine synthase family protein [Natroniella sulfidigena]MCK8816805.1 glutathionylspermidine synthase family protein [Natroniella sulfidigena]